MKSSVRLWKAWPCPTPYRYVWTANLTFASNCNVCLQTVFMCCPVDRHASVRSEAVDGGGGEIQLGGAAAGIHHGQTLDCLYTGCLAATTNTSIYPGLLETVHYITQALASALHLLKLFMLFMNEVMDFHYTLNYHLTPLLSPSSK